VEEEVIIIRCPHCSTDLELRYLWRAIKQSEFTAKESPSWRLTPLSEMYLSVRSENCLKLDYETAGDIDDAADRELLRIPNFGKRSLAEVREAIEEIKTARTDK
jgi:DNA-directed RNA polymerase alpha subunit